MWLDPAHPSNIVSTFLSMTFTTVLYWYPPVSLGTVTHQSGGSSSTDPNLPAALGPRSTVARVPAHGTATLLPAAGPARPSSMEIAKAANGFAIAAPDGADQFEGRDALPAPCVAALVARTCSMSHWAPLRQLPFLAKNGQTVPGGFLEPFPLPPFASALALALAAAPLPFLSPFPAPLAA